jgi:hypothetical protein
MRILVPVVLVFSLIGCSSVTSQVAREATLVPMFASRYEPMKGDQWEWAYDELWGRLEAQGVTIEEVPNLRQPETGGEVWGLTYRLDHKIQIEATVDPNARFEILAHEAGHLFHNSGMSQAQAEIFAESVGAGIQHFYGVPGAAKKSGDYLAGYKYGLPVLPYIRKDIDLAVKALTGQIEWKVEK